MIVAGQGLQAVPLGARIPELLGDVDNSAINYSSAVSTRGFEEMEDEHPDIDPDLILE